MTEALVDLVGNWKIEGELSFSSDLTTIDLANVKFIDENSNTVEASDHWGKPMWGEPPLVLKGTCELSIHFPDGSIIKNPSVEEVWEWVQGTQIPHYWISEEEFNERFN